MVYRVGRGILGIEYGDRVVLVGVYQAEVVATSLGVYLTDPRLPYLDCRK